MSSMINDIEIYQLSRHEGAMRSIWEADYTLRPVQRQSDRSAPVIDSTIVCRKFDRTELMSTLRSGVSLKSTTTSDRSAPVIDANVHIRYVERNIYLDAVLVGAHDFYSRMMANIHKNSLVTLAQIKAGQFYIASKEACEKGIARAGEIVHKAQERIEHAALVVREVANEAVANGKVLANQAQEKIVLTAHEIQTNVNEAIVTGKAKVDEAKMKANEAMIVGKAKVDEVIVTGKAKANEAITATKDAALIAQVKVTETIDQGKVLASETALKAQGKAETAISSGKAKASAVFMSGKEKLNEAQEKLHHEFHTQVLLDIQGKMSNYSSFGAFANRENLLHVRSNDIRDASKPFLPSAYALESTRANSLLARQEDLKAKTNKDLNNKATLKSLNHVVIYHDASKPYIEKVSVQKNDSRKQLLEEVKSTEISQLASTETDDRSAPVLPEAIELRESPMKALIEEVKQGKELEKNSEVNDRSAPAISSIPAM